MEHGRHGFNFLSGLGLPVHISGLLLVGFVLVVSMWIARSQLLRVMKMADGGLVPDAHFSYRNFFEMYAEFLFNLTEMILGEHHAKRFYPLIGSIFSIIITANLIGLIPGFGAPTSDINTTLAFGIFVFIFYNAIGIKENGLIKYFKHFMGPVIFLAPLIFVIEIISHLVRPLSLALRLRGNIDGDHQVLMIFNELVPIGIPVIFYGLGVFVSFMQAFVFSLLTMVYISLSTAHDH